MMHCTMDDLLALQAGEASGWARKHLETCAVCRAELDILYQRVAQLKALPGLRAPRDRWPAVRAVVLAGRDRRRRVWRVGTLAAAAALAGLLLLRPWGTDLEAQLVQAQQRSATLGRVTRASERSLFGPAVLSAGARSPTTGTARLANTR